MSDSRRCSSADSEIMREIIYKNLFAAGRSVKNVPRHYIFSPFILRPYIKAGFLRLAFWPYF
jgi:hypothetical protein